MYADYIKATAPQTADEIGRGVYRPNWDGGRRLAKELIAAGHNSTDACAFAARAAEEYAAR